jgi:hypothetical protein
MQYVMSRPIMKYLAETDDLYYYQGEDAGMMIILVQYVLVVFLFSSWPLFPHQSLSARRKDLVFGWTSLLSKLHFWIHQN